MLILSTAVPCIAQTAAPAPSGNTTVFLGDSITAFGNALETGPNNSFGWGWTAQATFLSKGRVLQVNNAGVPGNTLAQMLTRFQTDVVAYSPAKVVIAGGTNDIPTNLFTSAQLGTIAATLSSLIDAAEAAGIQPIVCDVPPREDAPVLIHAVNAKTLAATIRTVAAEKQAQYGNVVFFDLYSVVAIPLIGGYLPGYDLGDGIHLSVKAATAVANAFVSTTAMVYGSSAYLPWTNSSSINLVPNALFISPIGDGWNGYGSSPAPTVSVVTGDPSISGNWMKLQFPPGRTAGQYYSYNTSCVTCRKGTTYGLAFRFQISGLEANGGMVVVTYTNNGEGPTVAYNILEDVTDGTFYLEAPALSADLRPGIIVYPGLTGTITIKIAQVGLVAR